MILKNQIKHIIILPRYQQNKRVFSVMSSHNQRHQCALTITSIRDGIEWNGDWLAASVPPVRNILALNMSITICERRLYCQRHSRYWWFPKHIGRSLPQYQTNIVMHGFTTHPWPQTIQGNLYAWIKTAGSVNSYRCMCDQTGNMSTYVNVTGISLARGLPASWQLGKEHDANLANGNDLWWFPNPMPVWSASSHQLKKPIQVSICWPSLAETSNAVRSSVRSVNSVDT